MHGWNFPHQPNMNPGKGGRLGAITFSNSPEAMLCTPLPPLHQTLGPGASLAVSTPLRTERPVLMVGGSGGQDKEDKAGGGGLSNIRGSLGEPVALSSPAQAQDKPTSLGSTPPHSGTPGLSLSGHHGSIGPLAWTLAPVGGGRGSCLPGPGLGRASCWRTPHGHQGPGLTSQSSPFHPQPLRALASPFVAASSSQTR